MSQNNHQGQEVDCRLYLISPPKIDLATFPADLEQTLSAGDSACFQLRLKSATDDEVIAATKMLLPIAHKYDVAFILNDRPELAIQLGADGTHIGQSDTPYQKARSLVGDTSIIGVTCHDSRHLAMIAGEAGAEYVAFGAFFDTQTKDAQTRAPLDLLTWWQTMMEVPCVAIGGINISNIAQVSRAGADFIAVSSGVWNHPDGPAQAINALNTEITANPYIPDI